MANTFLQNLLGKAYREGMSEEEISKALEVYENAKTKETNAKIEVYANDITHLKETLSKKNSEAASLKNSLKEKMSESEREAAERAEQMQSLQDQVAALQAEKTRSETKTKFLSAGYSEADAESAMDAWVKQDIGAFMNALGNHESSFKDSIKSELMKGTQRPESGNTTPKPMTKDEFYKMPLQDRIRFAQEHREEYEEINKE